MSAAARQRAAQRARQRAYRELAELHADRFAELYDEARRDVGLPPVIEDPSSASRVGARRRYGAVEPPTIRA